MTPAPDVEAIVLAAGRGDRLGLGPKAWLVLGGRTLLERAVATAGQVAGRVIAGVPPDDVERARARCGAAAVVLPGAATRRGTLLAALAEARARWIVLHDVAHPFLTPRLAGEVLEAAPASGAAVAVVRAASTAYREVGSGALERLPPGEVWLMRRPFVFRRADFARGLETGSADDGLSVILARAGVATRLVPSPSWNIKLTTPDDWALALAIERGVGDGPATG